MIFTNTEPSHLSTAKGSTPLHSLLFHQPQDKHTTTLLFPSSPLMVPLVGQSKLLLLSSLLTPRSRPFFSSFQQSREERTVSEQDFDGKRSKTTRNLRKNNQTSNILTEYLTLRIYFQKDKRRGGKSLSSETRTFAQLNQGSVPERPSSFLGQRRTTNPLSSGRESISKS